MVLSSQIERALAITAAGAFSSFAPLGGTFTAVTTGDAGAGGTADAGLLPRLTSAVTVSRRFCWSSIHSMAATTPLSEISVTAGSLAVAPGASTRVTINFFALRRLATRISIALGSAI